MLTAHQKAARANWEKRRRITWLESRLDKYVSTAESFSPQTKTRKHWMNEADKMREQLIEISH